jgi:hypothetical protein
MGCFSATCSITRTEIASGEPVLVAFMVPYYHSSKVPRPFSTHSILSFAHFNEFNWKQNRPCGEFLYLSVEDYDDYGCCPKEVYDTYSNWWNYQFIAHKEVCCSLIGRELGEGIQLEKDFFEIVQQCNLGRIEVFQDLVGGQHLSEDELQIQELIYHETGRILSLKRESLDSKSW